MSMPFHTYSDAAWLNTTTQTKEQETKEQEHKQTTCVIPAAAEIDAFFKRSTSTSTSKTTLSPAPWTGLHLALFTQDTMNTVITNTEAAIARGDVPPAPAVVCNASNVVPSGMPAHDFGGRVRGMSDEMANRERTDNRSSNVAWSGISASLEDEFSSSWAATAGSPTPRRSSKEKILAQREISSTTAVAKQAASVPKVNTGEVDLQPETLRRPPKALQPSAGSQPWLGLAGEMQNNFGGASPSPPLRRSRQAKVAPSSAFDMVGKENASATAADYVAERAPPYIGYGYSDLSPLGLLS